MVVKIHILLLKFREVIWMYLPSFHAGQAIYMFNTGRLFIDIHGLYSYISYPNFNSTFQLKVIRMNITYCNVTFGLTCNMICNDRKRILLVKTLCTCISSALGVTCKKTHLYKNDILHQGFEEGLICVRYTIYMYYFVDGHSILTTRS